MTQCPVCGDPVSATSTICPGCGTALGSQVVQAKPDASIQAKPASVPPMNPLPLNAGARLVLLRAGVAASNVYPVGTTTVVGRFEPDTGPVDVDLAGLPEADYVSRHHAEINKDADGSWNVKDLGSTNGTFVSALGNGSTERVKDRRQLMSGDHVFFGNARFRFEIDP